HQIAVLWIPLFEEVPALLFGNGFRIAIVPRLLGNPYASAFTAGRFGHQPQLVFSRNRSGMDLDELTIGVEGSLLVKGGLRRSRADHRVRGLAEDGADTPGRDDDRVIRKSTYFHGAEIHGADSAAGAVGVEHHGEEFPMFVLQDLADRFMTAHLLVEGIQQLLTGGCPGKRRPVLQRSSKAAKIEQALRSTVKGDAHPV